jgi:2,3-bisphosphoglycerate-dependent phosphoglycerate mutase
MIQVVFETHSTSEDNERGAASGWHHSRLSVRGREQARELGRRRGDDGIAAVFSSDLRRAVETAETAFADTAIPVLLDWRLRECDYGDLNGGPAGVHHQSRRQFVDVPYPGGESWREAVSRVGGFLDDLYSRWDGMRVLIIGHVATRWALEHYLGGVPVEDLVQPEFAWQEGWEYLLASRGTQARRPATHAAASAADGGGAATRTTSVTPIPARSASIERS